MDIDSNSYMQKNQEQHHEFHHDHPQSKYPGPVCDPTLWSFCPFGASSTTFGLNIGDAHPVAPPTLFNASTVRCPMPPAMEPALGLRTCGPASFRLARLVVQG